MSEPFDEGMEPENITFGKEVARMLSPVSRFIFLDAVEKTEKGDARMIAVLEEFDNHRDMVAKIAYTKIEDPFGKGHSDLWVGILSPFFRDFYEDPDIFSVLPGSDGFADVAGQIVEFIVNFRVANPGSHFSKN